jgi:NTE family protein
MFEIELGLERQVGLWETRAMPYLFEAGRRAALRQLAQITALLRVALAPTPDVGSLAA